MDKKTKIFLLSCMIFIISVLLYNYYLQNDINANKVVTKAKVKYKNVVKGGGVTLKYEVSYLQNVYDITEGIDDARLYEIGSCYEVEISSKNPKHCRITPKQVPCE